MLYLFKADIDCTGLEDNIADGKASIFSGKKSIELLQVIQNIIESKTQRIARGHLKTLVKTQHYASSHTKYKRTKSHRVNSTPLLVAL